jgi:hypothetical protein
MRDGKPYTRPELIEAKLHELVALSREELLTRCEVRAPNDPRYVSSECLLYFLRSTRTEKSEKWFECIFKLLIERVLRALPKPEDGKGQAVSFSKSEIHDKAYGRFIDLLVADRQEYDDRLDIFECRFDLALSNLRLDAQRQIWRNERRSPSLYDESGAISAEVERAANDTDFLEEIKYADEDFRSRLNAAIDNLPPEQSRTIHMLLLEFPIDSKETDVMTISKALNKTEKTIRNYRDRAFSTLRQILGVEVANG